MEYTFDEIEHPGIREAFQKIFRKFLNATSNDERLKYWRLLKKLGYWQANEIEQRNWTNKQEGEHQ